MTAIISSPKHMHEFPYPNNVNINANANAVINPNNCFGDKVPNHLRLMVLAPAVSFMKRRHTITRLIIIGHAFTGGSRKSIKHNIFVTYHTNGVYCGDH
jgi:hypothetical protein